MPQWILWCAIFALGACIGSFLNVCIHRLPRGESIVGPRSACPACGAPIAWYDNVPIVSYVLLRGRCRRCGAPIAVRYLLVEAATGALFVLLFHVQGLTVLFRSQAFLGASLIALIPIDARHQILPDAITLPGIAVGLLTSPLRAAAAGSGSVPPFAAAREALLASAL